MDPSIQSFKIELSKVSTELVHLNGAFAVLEKKALSTEEITSILNEVHECRIRIIKFEESIDKKRKDITSRAHHVSESDKGTTPSNVEAVDEDVIAYYVTESQAMIKTATLHLANVKARANRLIKNLSIINTLLIASLFVIHSPGLVSTIIVFLCFSLWTFLDLWLTVYRPALTLGERIDHSRSDLVLVEAMNS